MAAILFTVYFQIVRQITQNGKLKFTLLQSFEMLVHNDPFQNLVSSKIWMTFLISSAVSQRKRHKHLYENTFSVNCTKRGLMMTLSGPSYRNFIVPELHWLG